MMTIPEPPIWSRDELGRLTLLRARVAARRPAVVEQFWQSAAFHVLLLVCHGTLLVISAGAVLYHASMALAAGRRPR